MMNEQFIQSFLLVWRTVLDLCVNYSLDSWIIGQGNVIPFLSQKQYFLYLGEISSFQWKQEMPYT